MMEELANAQDFAYGDIIIPVMGITGSGKSTFIARCTGNDEAVGHSLKSCTKEVSYATFKYRDRTIRLIDTPGFDDSDGDDSKIFKEISYWLLAAYVAKPPLLLSGIIYLHPITNVRMKGTDKSNLALFQALCGEENWSSVVMATTMWAKVDPEVGEKRQKALAEKYWKDLSDVGAQITKHEDSQSSALSVIDHILEQNKYVALQIQRQLSSGTELLQTDAGQELNRKLNKEREAAEQHLAEVKAELNDAQQRKDAEDAQELLEMETRYRDAIHKKNLELQKMRMDIDMIIREKKEEMEKAEETRAEQSRVAQEQYAAITQELETIKLSQQERAVVPADFQSMNLSSADQSIEARIKEHELQMRLNRERQRREIDELKRHQEMLRAARENTVWAKRGVIVDTTSSVIGLGSLGVGAGQLASQLGSCQVM